jgi:hypothetical protein
VEKWWILTFGKAVKIQLVQEDIIQMADEKNPALAERRGVFTACREACG